MKSILEKHPVEHCYLCGRYGQLEDHHIFGGNKNRKNAEKFGLKVHLCVICHRDQRAGVHSDQNKMQYLHEIGQQAFEKRYSRSEFVQIFGKNYLEEEPDRQQGEMDTKDGFLWI